MFTSPMRMDGCLVYVYEWDVDCANKPVNVGKRILDSATLFAGLTFGYLATQSISN